ncbi:sulfotransferase family 2 domain-containing protein [Thetidibacter halocola]|uniref:Sulfotransferase family 2 domain-containing protein n=1 Tax=Thetidibacter halocola TaxID=2827239 RepID=A0A8J7WEY9_9RHOB|nr:sulfotransferase family 2 domain-containing protein [Thetidibacter halocola]MBS0123853.1 sulfotransferase family 2 domain-containing protein [Thetidibacter halocola]
MILLHDHKLAYVSVPKCACTSAKNLFFEIENGVPFKPFAISGKTHTLHDLARSRPFESLPHQRIADYVKVAIVRDPVARIRSCYQDKILKGLAFRRKPDVAAARKAGLDVKPSFETFVEKLDTYRKASGVVQQHSEPLSHFLGADPAWFDALFDISEAEAFAALVRERTGSTLAMPHRNRTKNAADTAPVSDAVRDAIRNRFAQDYDLYGRWFAAKGEQAVKA